MKFFSILTLISLCIKLNAQNSGVFKFMDIPNNARAASLGGVIPTHNDSSIEYASSNPSLLSKTNEKNILINYTSYLADIHAGYLTYVINTNKKITIAPFVKYLHYGNFVETDETGQQIRNFTATDLAVGTSISKEFFTHFRYGINVNAIYSQLLYNNAAGLSTDYYIYYSTNSEQWGTTLAIENLGTQLFTYSKSNYEFLPLQVRLAGSLKLKKAPIRLHGAFNNLNRWDLVPPNETNQTVDPFTGEVKKKTLTLDNFSRHLAFAATLSPSKAFALNIGYDVRRGKESGFIDRKKLAGFSFGINIKLKKIIINYSLYGNGSGLNSNYFTLSFISLGKSKY